MGKALRKSRGAGAGVDVGSGRTLRQAQGKALLAPYAQALILSLSKYAGHRAAFLSFAVAHHTGSAAKNPRSFRLPLGGR